jgi:uncharacterized protein YbjQ (UPF0145 family)
MPLFGNGPYMSLSRGLSNPRPDLLAGARYQIVPSLNGLPSAQLSLTFRRNIPIVTTNPDMSLAVLLDRSGSMQEAFREGHVYNVASAILNHVAAAGAGYDLVFYDDQVWDAGHMRTLSDVRYAVQRYGPNGGTYVASALRHVIRQYKKRAGIYIIVITDGEFADKQQVMDLVTRELLPQLTPQHPYAFRLHFVGAGEGVDHQFLRQIEDASTGQGVPLVTQHHHAHLSHSHASILDELDKAFMGVGINARVGEPALVTVGTQQAAEGEHVVHGVVDAATRRTWHAGVGELGFMPRRATLNFEYSPVHPPNMPVSIHFDDVGGHTHQFMFTVPMPKAQQAPGAQTGGIGGLLSRLHLPWQHSQEDVAARAEAQRKREALQQLAVQVHEAEMKRQAADLRELARGGIPIQAVERLKEIGDNEADEVIFTSNLDPDEAALLRREGYDVRGIVTGSAIYHVGQAYASTQGDCEVSVLSDAYNEATRLAVSRMQKELDLIGAHGVVGVRLSLVRHEWAEKTVEVQVIGTAIEGRTRPTSGTWMCDLSGQEWWALYRAGYESVGLVWGHCTWFLLTTQYDEWNEKSFQNVEITHWSDGLSSARHRAMAHVLRDAKHLNATGVCGVRIERRLDEVRLSGSGENPAYEREHHNLVLSIVGTAIRVRANAPTAVKPTLNVLSLRDGRLSPVGVGVQDLTVE